MKAPVCPIKGYVLLVDDPDEVSDGGVVHESLPGRGVNMDFYAATPGPGFGAGDLVLVSDPNAGRRIKVDGIPYRVVREDEIIGVLEPA